MHITRTLSLALGLALAPAMATATTRVTTAEGLQPIYQAPIGQLEADKFTHFVVNPALGRAWVEVVKHYDFTDSPMEIVRVEVPGLRYDAERSAVVLNAGGKVLECAKVRERDGWLFDTTRVEPTGQCELTQRYVKVPVDDGFAVERVEQFQVLLNPAS